MVVNDGTDSSSTATVTVNVTPVNDVPTAINLTQTKAYTEGAASVALDDIVVTDADTGDTDAGGSGARLSDDERGGNLQCRDRRVDGRREPGAGECVAALAFNPSTDNDVNTSITTHIRDGANTGPANGTITRNATPVNDAPTGMDKAVTMAANTGYAFAASDFGFSDSTNLSPTRYWR
jgi:trimeric autotransporter adhesin